MVDRDLLGEMRADELRRFEGIPSEDELGAVVREEIEAYMRDRAGKDVPDHVYENLPVLDREVYRRIGVAVMRSVLAVLADRVLPEIPVAVFSIVLDDRQSAPATVERFWVVDVHRHRHDGVAGVHSRAKHANPVEAIRLALRAES